MNTSTAKTVIIEAVGGPEVMKIVDREIGPADTVRAMIVERRIGPADTARAMIVDREVGLAGSGKVQEVAMNTFEGSGLISAFSGTFSLHSI